MAAHTIEHVIPVLSHKLEVTFIVLDTERVVVAVVDATGPLFDDMTPHAAVTEAVRDAVQLSLVIDVGIKRPPPVDYSEPDWTIDRSRREASRVLRWA